ncbi:hypothetical protein SLEP1_g21183 [Rubroshorea leprosula]|uniref:Uncharacterized protein n=1 Tax=Rubroshorea leprosula TaxID=152421 RepID=A0AAV5JEC7_9ROSI|nr:hypothetical protein SLEP1_g21183 [Rubroshorea leprosula]
MENNNSTSNWNGKSTFGDGAKTTNEQEENYNVYYDDNHLNIESEEEEKEDEEEEEEEGKHEREEALRQSLSRSPFTNRYQSFFPLDLWILVVNLVEMIEDGISALEAKLFDVDGCVRLINYVVWDYKKHKKML